MCFLAMTCVRKCPCHRQARVQAQGEPCRPERGRNRSKGKPNWPDLDKDLSEFSLSWASSVISEDDFQFV